MKFLLPLLMAVALLPLHAFAECAVSTFYDATTAPYASVGDSTFTPGSAYMSFTETGGNKLIISSEAANKAPEIAKNCLTLAIEAQKDTTSRLFQFGYFGADTDVVTANGGGCLVNINTASLHHLVCRLGNK